MKLTVLCFFFISPVVLFGQMKDMAIGRYAERGNLVSISNLTELSECTPASVMGKVGKVRIEESAANTSISAVKSKTKDKSEHSDEKVNVPLDRVKPADRTAMFKQLVRKSVIVTVSGYRCNPDDAIIAFSIDRVY
jgi:hypothetical protein